MKPVKTLKQALIINSLLVALLPILVVGLVSYKFYEHDFLEEVSRDNMTLATIVAREVSDYLTQFREQITTISRMNKCTEVVAGRDFKAFIDPDGSSVPELLCLARRNGRIPPTASIGDRFGLAHFAGGQFGLGKEGVGRHSWSDVFIAASTGMPSVSLAVPAGSDQCMVGSLNLRRLNSMIARVSRDQKYAYIVDRQGRLVSHPDISLAKERRDVSDLSAIKAGMLGKYGSYRYVFQGVDRIASVAVIPETGWLLAVAQPVDQAFAPLRKVKLTFVVGLAMTGGLALVSAFGSIQLLLRPLDTLGRNAELITAGDYALKDQASGFRELDALTERFVMMAEAVDQREEELMQRNEELTMTEEELRQQMDEALQSHDELCKAHILLQTVVDASPVAISCLDLEGRVILWNPAAERTSGWQATEVVGLVSPLLAPESDDARRHLLQEIVRDGAVLDRDVTLFRKGGSSIDLRFSGTVLRGGDGAPYGVLALYDDITARKAAEQEIHTLNAELEQRVKARTVQLEAANRELESFCYTVSHDLRAPLRHIDGFSHALLEDCGALLSSEGVEHLARVRRGTARMAQLIDDLLELSRMSRGQMQLERVDLSGMVNEILADLAKDAPARSVELVIADGVRVNADPRLIRVVMDNLLGNAWKYTGRKRSARIEFGTEMRNGEQICFVSDDGAGFDMAYADKLFGPFQRLHGVEEFEGTGVGLATVQRIIHRHGGSVWGEGVPGAGATFYFTLPDYAVV